MQNSKQKTKAKQTRRTATVPPPHSGLRRWAQKIIRTKGPHFTFDGGGALLRCPPQSGGSGQPKIPLPGIALPSAHLVPNLVGIRSDIARVSSDFWALGWVGRAYFFNIEKMVANSEVLACRKLSGIAWVD